MCNYTYLYLYEHIPVPTNPRTLYLALYNTHSYIRNIVYHIFIIFTVFFASFFFKKINKCIYQAISHQFLMLFKKIFLLHIVIVLTTWHFTEISTPFDAFLPTLSELRISISRFLGPLNNLISKWRCHLILKLTPSLCKSCFV